VETTVQKNNNNLVVADLNHISISPEAVLSYADVKVALYHYT
jgi:hypothetical protein